MQTNGQKKLVAVLNKNLEGGVLLNALGHMAIGLGGLLAKLGCAEDLRLLDYVDKDGGVYPSISYYPFIVLRAKSGEIRKLRQQALQNNVPFVNFLDTMTIGTSDEQVAKTKETSEEGLDFYGICLFGDKPLIDELTRKFSLWR